MHQQTRNFDRDRHGAGGGGNSFVHPSGTNRVMASGVRSGDGLVSITYFVPSITAGAAPAANAFGWNNADVGVTFSATNPCGSPIDSITYSTTGAESRPNTTVAGGSLVVGISAEGTTTARGIARDDGGSESAPATISVNIDKTPR